MKNSAQNCYYRVLARETGNFTLKQLQAAADDLSMRYRNVDKRKEIKAKGQPFVYQDAHYAAYASVRMPATYAAAKRVFKEMQKHLQGIEFESLLDIGAGPGTILWAIADLYPDISLATLIERDAKMIALGKRLAKGSMNPLISHASWMQGDASKELLLPQHDLVTMSYMLSEIPGSIEEIVHLGWNLSRKAMAIIEPGTPYGFETILKARSLLIKLGANIAAPCPHTKACPMAGGNWCHFAERLERGKEHRQIKSGDLGYEDEKYSYLIAAKEPVTSYQGRILRHPQKHSGHMDFILCTAEGLQHKKLTKSQGEIYKKARKLDWGDTFDGCN